MRLTKSELEVMEVYWRVGEPLSQLELLAHTHQKSWKDRSVYILLNGLLSKGVLEETGFVRSGKTFARRFAPTVTYEDYCAQEIIDRKKPYNFPRLMSAMIKKTELTREDVEEMQRMVDEARRNLEEK